MAGPVYNCVWLFLCTLYPAYASFKAVKTKNVKEYVSGETVNNAYCNLLTKATSTVYLYRYAAAGEVYDVLDCVRPLLRGGESARPLRQHLPPVLHGGGGDTLLQIQISASKSSIRRFVIT